MITEWAKLTDAELAQLDRELPVILPAGLVEAHGPALTLGLDNDTAEHFARTVCDGPRSSTGATVSRSTSGAIATCSELRRARRRVRANGGEQMNGMVGAVHSAAQPVAHAAAEEVVVGRPAEGVRLVARRHAAGWGLGVEGVASGEARWPVVVELYVGENVGEDADHRVRAAYQTCARDGAALVATAVVPGPAGASFHFRDTWTAGGGVLTVDRCVSVEGTATDGFLSALLLDFPGAAAWTDVQAFAPGMLYGHGAHVRDVAIGGTAHYRDGVRQVRIREDRLPAPLFGLRFTDGSTVSLLHEAPEGGTTADDSLDVDSDRPQIHERFRFVSLGGVEEEGRMALGVWFPGTEGEVM